MTPSETALSLLAEGLWPVPITAHDDARSINPGKAPIGKAWGLKRHTPESLAAVYAKHPGAGVGLKLGPEGGVIDIDVDDPSAAKDTLLTLFGGEVPDTRGWTSARGYHWLYRWDERLAGFKKAIVKIPGLEVRIGWSNEGKQYQSVVPPSVGADGQPRVWNEHAEIKPLPDSVYAALADFLRARERPVIAGPAPKGGWSAEARAAAYLQKCQPAVSGDSGHDQAFKVACKVGPGFDLPPDVTIRLIAEVYNPTCEPPWSEKELRHKVEDAYANEPRRGWLLNADRNPRPERNGEGGGNGETGQPVELPDDPFALARSYLTESAAPDGTITLRYWLEEWHEWRGDRYQIVSNAEVRARLVAHVKGAFDRTADEAGKFPAKVTTGIVANTIQALASLAVLPKYACPDQPAWLDFRHEDLPDPRQVIPARNGLIHLPALVEGREAILPPTPRFFSPNCLDYAFDQNAARPTQWLNFLESVWGDDPESVAALQEWFGYLLTPDTSQQKILVLIGPTRSGKGTIGRTLTSLVGTLNVSSPTLSGLANNFGLSPLIGKTLAIFPDARLSGRADSQVIVERLLSISGEDGQTIDRKHLTSWSGHLTTRFVLISNELPRLGDSSGAITARTVVLRMTRSFLNKEDTDLQRKITAELPGILLWAIAGWARLRRRGRFLQPDSGNELLDEMRDLSAPINAFIEERCDLGDELQSPIPALYGAWKSFCTDQGKEHPGDERGFGKMLRAAIPTLKVSRPGTSGKRHRIYQGIALHAGF